MALKLHQSAIGARSQERYAVARPVVSAGRSRQIFPAKRQSCVVRVAEMDRTAEEDALMFCYQVSGRWPSDQATFSLLVMTHHFRQVWDEGVIQHDCYLSILCPNHCSKVDFIPSPPLPLCCCPAV